MSVTAQWEKLEGNEGKLTITVSADRFEEALDEAFKKVVKDVNIPGFRKGRVPRPIFEQRFGVESLYQDAIDIVLPSAYSEAVEQTGIFPVDQPSINIDEIERGKDLVFVCEVTVKPEVTLGEYKGLEVENTFEEVTDEDVETELETQRQGQAELVIKEEGEDVEGDTVVIDYEGFVDDVPFEGGKADNHSLEIGSGQFIPGLEDGVIGKEAGKEEEVSVIFREEYHAEDLAGKEAIFKVTIHEMKEKEVPELDDEFAKDVDEEVESLAELKEKTKERLTEERKQAAENAKRQSLVELVYDNATIDIPEAMIEMEIDQMMNELGQQIQMQGMDLKNFFEFSGQSEEDFRNQMKDDAQKRVKTNLTLEAIIEAENIEPSDEDVDKELDKMAEMYNLEKDQIVSMLGGNTDMLKNDLKMAKVIDFLAEQSVEKA